MRADTDAGVGGGAALEETTAKSCGLVVPLGRSESESVLADPSGNEAEPTGSEVGRGNEPGEAKLVGTTGGIGGESVDSREELGCTCCRWGLGVIAAEPPGTDVERIGLGGC